MGGASYTDLRDAKRMMFEIENAERKMPRNAHYTTCEPFWSI